jgi:hypothetical protein
VLKGVVFGLGRIADSAAMADQYGHKEALCQALAGLSPDDDDEVYMQVFANFTNWFWGKDFGSR